MIHDLKNNLGIVDLLNPQDVVKTDTVSSILDTAGFDGAAIAVSVGTITGGIGANDYVTPVLQESATIVGTDFTEVATADIIGGFTVINAGTKDNVVQVAGYKGAKRYIRVNLDFSTGTTTPITATPVSVIGILGKAHAKPVTAPDAVSAT